MNSFLPLFMALTLLGLSAPVLGDPIRFHPPAGAGDRLPFSEAVEAQGVLYLSGMIGNRPGTSELVPGGIQAETRQAMENIRATVLRHGGSMERVVKCTVFLADMGEWAAMNEVYVQFFPGGKPARSALGASGLALEARVEIECLVVLED